MNGRVDVAQGVAWYFPDSTGGTEVYVQALAGDLAAFGVRARIAAPAGEDREESSYEWNGASVYRYPVSSRAARRESRGQPDAGFERWLVECGTRVYHQHNLTRHCGLAQLASARALGLKTIVTLHLPGDLCPRGTMMLEGERACDGRVDVARCTRCWGTSRGIPGTVARWEARHPSLSVALAKFLPRSPVKTALSTPALVEARQAELAELLRLADRIVAVSRWQRDALLLNGFPPDKVVYCAQGTSVAPAPRACARVRGGSLRVGFLGRWERVKGIHLLVEAVRALPERVPVDLVIHGVTTDQTYEREVRALAHGDARIRIEPPVARERVPETLAGFDVVAVPSTWMETGPLVALEALAVGVPVLGSDLGGLKEIVEPGVNGLLVGAGDVAAWREAIVHLATAPWPVAFERIAAPRSSRDVAKEMADVYRDLLSGHPIP